MPEENINAKYQIKIHSCKGDNMLTYFLNPDQAQLLQEIAVASQLSSKSECEPTMFVTPVGKLTVEAKEGENA